ncbi:iron-sulfur cluster biosynthesis family protein [Mesobacillus harenae]|uniref:iron-sulfur cluster biosynthesis family protein n=1 Tax=Mesobacillus harenae TaxID=2213203 RepID=UPI00158095EC
MQITITESAVNKLEKKTAGKTGYLKLKYDTEGCGCVVSGVSALWLVNELENGDFEIETNFGPIYIEKSKEVFFEDQMTIDYTDSANCFQLKSPNQYINPRMSFSDKTMVKA